MKILAGIWLAVVGGLMATAFIWGFVLLGWFGLIIPAMLVAAGVTVWAILTLEPDR